MSTRHASWGALLGVLLFLACSRDSTEAEIVGPEEPSPTAEEVGSGPLSLANLTLPYEGTTSTPGAAFTISNSGTGYGGVFANAHQSGNPALLGVSYGSGPGVDGRSDTGPAGRFRVINPNSTATALDVLTGGRGNAGLFRISNPNAFAFAVQATTNGLLQAISGVTTGTGGAAVFQINSTSNNKSAVEMSTRGTGTVLDVDHKGSTGALAEFQVNGANRIRFTRDGKGIFNGGTQTGGADVAEAFAVEGHASAYEPGDVLVISTRSDRTVEKASERYSTRVAGVYATKPGLLLTERGVDDGLDGLVPVGVIGVIPTKVSAENGPIRRGDLLVSANTPGYAMRADPDRLRFGMVLGKALGELGRGERGMIPVLVNVK